MEKDKTLSNPAAEALGGAPRYRSTERDPEALKKLHHRINRIIGQLGGISRMLDENRYCSDILVQVAAAQSALRALGHEVLQEHMLTCVTDGVRAGDEFIVPEVLELIKRLK